MTRTLAATAIVSGLLALGCGTTPPPPPPANPPPTSALQAEFNGAPKWVSMGCSAFSGEKKNFVCGVGTAPGGMGVSMARTTAEGRGRTEIARSLQLRVKSMLKDYQSTTAAGGKFQNEQHVEDVSKQITDMTLNGTRLQEMWASSTNNMYALMVLDVSAFKDQLKTMKDLDEQVRAAVVERADKAFGELDAATEGKAAEPPSQ